MKMYVIGVKSNLGSRFVHGKVVSVWIDSGWREGESDVTLRMLHRHAIITRQMETLLNFLFIIY